MLCKFATDVQVVDRIYGGININNFKEYPHFENKTKTPIFVRVSHEKKNVHFSLKIKF